MFKASDFSINLDNEIISIFNKIIYLSGNTKHKNNPSDKFRLDLFNYLLVNHDSNNLLELGTFHGGTTAILALVAKIYNCHVFSIDWKNHKLEIAKNIAVTLNLEKYITFLEINLYEENYINKLKDKNISFGFIDAKHEYDAIKMDTDNLILLNIKKIAFHDFGLNNIDGPNLSVKKVLNNYNIDYTKINNNIFKFIGV